MGGEAMAMTRSSPARRERRLRRGRGRPPHDYSDDPNLVVAETAIALEIAWGMSERRAIDLALAIHVDRPNKPSKIPRGGKAGLLVGYTLPNQESFHGRNRDIRRKLQTGKLIPDANVVRAIARLLHKIHTRRF
jgi:hypothetical protein